MPTLTPELIATLKQLSPDERELVRDLLDEDARAAWREELKRRAELVASGDYTALSVEQVNADVHRAVEVARRR